MPTFRVGTFYHPIANKPPTKSRIDAYTLWYDPSWKGCVEFEVEAASGTLAKKEAISMRLVQEIDRVLGEAGS